MIKAYKNYWKGYVDFKGRTDRRGYWLAVLAGFIVSILINIINQTVTSQNSGSGYSVIVMVYSLATFLPSLSITVRRLRDGGNSWSNIFWVFLPIAGPIILIVKLCASTQAQNPSQSGSAAASRETQFYRPYQSQTTSAAAPKAPAGATTVPAASKPVYTPSQTGGSTKVPLSSLRPYHGNGVCDVCNRSLSGENAYIVPNNVFYASPEYRKHYADINAVFFSLSGQSAEQALTFMQLRDQSEGSAVCESCIHMFADRPTPEKTVINKQEQDSEKPKPNKDTFYVFAAQGAAFGNAPGDVGAIIMEKAEKLRDGYEPAKSMELSVISPDNWGGRIEVSRQNGVICSSFSFADHKNAIRSYLEKAGVDSTLIEEGIAASEKESLQLSNPFSGVTVIGIPIAAAKPVSASASPTDEENLPTHLLVRFDIEKLSSVSGAYGFYAGKLLGSAVPSDLMEMMIISDGDSAATLNGEEQVYLIDISASGSSPETLGNKIMPLIQQNEELLKYTVQPPVQLCFDTAAEPLVICGVVRNARITGAGGLCASGLTNAWKEN